MGESQATRSRRLSPGESGREGRKTKNEGKMRSRVELRLEKGGERKTWKKELELAWPVG